MSFLKYLPVDDRRELVRLQDEFNLEPVPKNKASIQLRMQEIRNRSKSVAECNIEECADLRSQIHQQIEKLLALGKSSHARQYGSSLRDIDNRLMMLQIEAEKAELDRVTDKGMAKAKPANKKNPSKTTNNNARAKWLVNLDDSDELD